MEQSERSECIGLLEYLWSSKPIRGKKSFYLGDFDRSFIDYDFMYLSVDTYLYFFTLMPSHITTGVNSSLSENQGSQSVSNLHEHG